MMIADFAGSAAFFACTIFTILSYMLPDVRISTQPFIWYDFFAALSYTTKDIFGFAFRFASVLLKKLSANNIVSSSRICFIPVNITFGVPVSYTHLTLPTKRIV